MQLKYLLLFLGSLCFRYSWAQQTPGEEEMKMERTKAVKMPKYYKASLPQKSMAVADIQVIQAFPDSTRLGFLQKGLKGSKVVAVPAENMTILLQDYITKQYENDYKKEGVKLLLVIRNLRINERTFFSTERAFARLLADAYISSDGNLYRHVTTTDTVQVYGTVMDATSSHGQNIAAALHKLIVHALDKAQSCPAEIAAGIPFDQIAEDARKVVLHPIQKTEVYKGGVYLTFREFLENNPSLRKCEVSRESKGTARIFAINPDSTKTEIIPWGLCNRGKLYKYHESTLVPITKYGNEFMITGYIALANYRNKSLFVGGLTGGMIGYAVASSKADQLHSVTAIPYITKKQPEASVIDMKTGEFTF